MIKEILICSILLTIFNCYSQDLLPVEWQKTVLANSDLSVFATTNDIQGNIYTLGCFTNMPIFFGDTLDQNIGRFFLIKQNSAGEKLFVKNFGGTHNFTSGDLKLCANGDIVLGLNFIDKFFLNGIVIDSTSVLGYNSIILKLDEDFNLIWYKSFLGKGFTYIKKLILDDKENIYTSLLFVDSLHVDDEIYSHVSSPTIGYSTAILKLSTSGTVLWSHHYYSDYYVLNNFLKFRKSDNSCPSTIFIGGLVHNDSIFIDGVLKTVYNGNYNDGQLFIATINEFGDVLQTRFMEDGIRNITDIEFYENRIFFAGQFGDTVSWNEKEFFPSGNKSIYIGELNDQLDLIGFTDVKSSDNIYLSTFIVSPQYGFVISGAFDGSSYLQSSSISIASQFDRSGYIANLDGVYTLQDCKYIKGGYFSLGRIAIDNNHITGAAVFKETNYFQNDTCFALNIGVSVFKTDGIKVLPNFSPQHFPIVEFETPFSVKVYPNPVEQYFQVQFSKPIYAASLKLINAIGQTCKNINISQINNQEISIDATVLSPGIYFLQYLTCDKLQGTHKIIKI